LRSLPKDYTDDSFIGQPDASLAAALFQAGQRESVKEWIELCARYINVTSWRAKISVGISPWLYEREERRKYFDFSRLPRTAFNKKQWEKAKQTADEFLALSTAYTDDQRHYGFGMHTAYCVMGQLALRYGDTDSSRRFLEKAGKVPAAERLVEHGPDFALALDLLEVGEKECVQAFLKDCKRLWGRSHNSYLLKEWAKSVDAGNIPNDWKILCS